MNNIKKFVTNLLKGLFNEDDKKELIEILTTSLEEKVDDLVEQGKTREQAIEESITDFGNADDVLDAFPHKEKLNKLGIKKRRNSLVFALLSYAIIVGLALYINLAWIPERLWFIFIAIGLLFWPLSMLYHYLGVRK